jgi:hypothetical protein
MVELLNEDLSREYQANVAFTIYSQTIKGERIRQADSMREFALGEVHRKIIKQEHDHLLDLSNALGIDAPKIGNQAPALSCREGLRARWRSNQTNRTQSSDWVIAQPKAGCRIKGRLG